MYRIFGIEVPTSNLLSLVHTLLLTTLEKRKKMC